MIFACKANEQVSCYLAIGNNLHSPFGALILAVAEVFRSSEIERDAVNLHDGLLLSLVRQRIYIRQADDPLPWPQCWKALSCRKGVLKLQRDVPSRLCNCSAFRPSLLQLSAGVGIVWRSLQKTPLWEKKHDL